MEALRKMCYLNPELWQENFITYRYFDIKFFQSFITSVRMVKDGGMKVLHFDGEKKLKVKQTGYEQVGNWIKVNLKEKDVLASKLDAQYRYQNK